MKLSTKRVIVLWLMVFLGGILWSISTQAGGLDDEVMGDESWTVETRKGLVFYTTHGKIVEGLKFGFFKSPENCESDILWLNFSSSEEKVKDFIGKDVMISLEVDGVDFRINPPMLGAHTIGFTHVMLFTNWVVGERLMDALMKGRYVTVQIVEPKQLEVLLDIKEERFSLDGFVASRKEAMTICNRIDKE